MVVTLAVSRLALQSVHLRRSLTMGIACLHKLQYYAWPGLCEKPSAIPETGCNNNFVLMMIGSLHVLKPSKRVTFALVMTCFLMPAVSCDNHEEDGPKQYVVTTLAGNGQIGFNDGPATEAMFKGPIGIACDNTGNIYVADGDNNRIRKIAIDGTVTTVAGSGTPGLVNGTASDAEFFYPAAVAYNDAGDIYVADYANHCIRKISSGGVTTFAGTGLKGYADGDGSTAMFDSPQGLSLDKSGNLYVADSGNKRIRKVTPDGHVSTVAGGGGEFGYPTGVVCGDDFDLYVVDMKLECVYEIDSDQVVSPIICNTLGGARPLGVPWGIARDRHGDLFVTDAGGAKIVKLSEGNDPEVVAGSNIGHNDGVGEEAEFSNPYGITIDKYGIIYVVEQGNHDVRKITIK